MEGGDLKEDEDAKYERASRQGVASSTKCERPLAARGRAVGIRVLKHTDEMPARLTELLDPLHGPASGDDICYRNTFLTM